MVTNAIILEIFRAKEQGKIPENSAEILTSVRNKNQKTFPKQFQ
jgi:hypothetical protein